MTGLNALNAEQLRAKVLTADAMYRAQGRKVEALTEQLGGAVRERDTALADRVRLVGEVERLRLQVAALENDGMELAAKLGEAEEQIARLTASGRQ